MSNQESIQKTFTVAFLLCLVCSVIVSTAAVMLKPAQIANKSKDFKINILKAGGLYEQGRADGKSIEEMFESVTTKLVDLETGEVQSKLWKSWLEKDPTRFLNKRKAALKGKTIYLDVGKYDNYSLQFGTRQIAKLLKKQKVKTIYGEFSGTHRGLSKRRLIALQWLKKVW